MEARQGKERSDWRPMSKLTSGVELNVGSLLLMGDKDLLAGKSEKIVNLLKQRPHEDLSVHLSNIPADQETLDLVSRFCHGLDIKLSTTNVIRVAAVALFLGMTENQCHKNLFKTAEMFFEEHVIPSWNESVKALKSVENILQQALETGLVDRCVKSLISKALDNPLLLGEPAKIIVPDGVADYENENAYRPNARRKLFHNIDWRSADLSLFSIRIYTPVMHEMIRCQVPQEYVAASVCQYAKKWLFEKGGDSLSVYIKREVVTKLEHLLPLQKGMVPVTFLFEMLKYAMLLDADTECRDGLEVRIGKQLDHACVADLLIPMQGYAKDEHYDTEVVRRILKHFYENYSRSDASGLYAVAELIEEFLAEISADEDLKMTTFMAFADMSVSASRGLTRNSADGLYRALDMYLSKHRHLTESEKDELCGILDCSNLSKEAREHAALNQRLPLRIVVQVLFFRQLRLSSAFEADEEEVREEIEKMGTKVSELERECDDMKKEMQKVEAKNEKRSVWKEVKRKFGCGTSLYDRDCHVRKKKKVHPR